MAQLKLFDVGKLGEFSPVGVASELDTCIKRAIEHCRSNPTDDRVRKVVLQIELVPRPDKTGDLPQVELAFQCTMRAPSSRLPGVVVDVKRNGTLTWSPVAEED